MIKPRDVRRGGATTRLKQSSSPHNSNNNKKKHFSCLNGVGVVLSAKSKRERLRKLTSFPPDFHMPLSADVSDDRTIEDDDHLLPSRNRFKLPRKFLNDCNGVDHPSVPRKLRSAMKKRNRDRESAPPSLPNSKKLNHTMSGIYSPKRDVPVNKSKPNSSYMKQQETVSGGDITKDEEEVVETLYALAGLFPDNDLPNDNTSSKLDTESLDANPAALPQSKENPTPTFEVGSNCPLRATEAACPPSVQRLAKETAQLDFLNKLTTQHEPELPNTSTYCINSDNFVPQNLSASPLSAKVEDCNEKPTSSAVNFCVPSDQSLDSRSLKQPMQKESSLFRRTLQTTTNGSQVEMHDRVHESKKSGPVLWPGLSSNVSHGARNDSPSSSSQSPAAKIPSWLDAALSSSRTSVQNGSSFGKVTKVINSRRSVKKCAAHVYISHLIQALQNSESKDKLQLQSNQMRPHEGTKQGDLMGVNTHNTVKNGLNGIVSPSSTEISTEKSLNEAKNSTLQQKKLHQDQPESAMGSRAYTTPKQSFDFLSLSAGGGGFESNDSFGRARNGMEPLSQSQVPYTQSYMRHHTLIPFSLPQSHYNSSACHNNSSVAQQAQLQLPPYRGNPFGGPQASPRPLTKQQPQQHLQLQQQHQMQQQQQRLWAAHLAAQYRPIGTTAPAVHFQSWQNGRQETTLFPCGQAVMSPSPSTLELVGPKYASLSQQQQQQLMAVTSSFPPGRVKRQDHHLPFVYEESGAGFRAGSALPLQLLCSERL